MKKTWIGIVVCSSLLTGIGLTYAKIIPGVDEPYNPSAYYSSTAVSRADSPSPFFYRDLARGGGIVYDPERHRNSILSCIKYEEILKTVQELFNKKKEDKTPFGNNGIGSGLQEVQQQTASLNFAKSINERAEKVFLNEKLSDEDFKKRSKSVQIQYLNDVYRTVSENAQKSLENAERRRELLAEAMQRSATAQGIMQAEQARLDIEALQQEEFAERNMLLGNFAAMDAVTRQYEVSKDMLNARHAMDAKAQSGFSDPYHYDAFEKKNYEKPKPIGLPNF